MPVGGTRGIILLGSFLLRSEFCSSLRCGSGRYGSGDGLGSRARHAHSDAHSLFLDDDFPYTAVLNELGEFTNLIDIHVIVLLRTAGLLLQQKINAFGCAMLA